MQPLDARSLLAARAVLQTTANREKSIASSTPPSSLDLEWEHEGKYVPLLLLCYCYYLLLLLLLSLSSL